MEENQILVSVIVPLYNAEAYLEQCLDSICGQTLREIEIICVDDGSTDRTPEILENYRQRDSRIRILQQENQFAGAARNNGMRHASGKYLMFWDGDDWFEENALETMYRKAEEDSADICVCGSWTYFQESGETVPAYSSLIMKYLPEEIPFSRETMPDHILNFTTGVVWNKLMRRSFLVENDLTFRPYRNGEDVLFVEAALCLAKRITVTEDRLVYYRIREDSVSMTVSRAVRQQLDAWTETYDYLKQRDALPERSFANRAFSNVLTVLQRLYPSWKQFDETVSWLREGGLASMGVTEQEPGYYDSAWKDGVLHHLLHDSTGEFVLYWLYDTQIRLRVAGGNVRSLRDRNGRLHEKLDGTKSKLERSREHCAREEAKIEKLQGEKEELRDRIHTLRQQKKELTESREYQLGKKLLKVPRKLRGGRD